MHVIRHIARSYGILVVTGVLFVVLAVTADGFATLQNQRNVIDQQSGVLIAAVFVTILMIASQFDISTSAVFVVAPLFALRVENATGSIPLAVVTGLVVGLAMGLVNGAIVTRLKIDSFIATLATSFIFSGIGFLISDRSILRPVEDGFDRLARSRFLTLTSASWIAIATVFVAGVLLTRTKFGRDVFAVGSNREAARLAGVAVRRIEVTAFALVGLAASLAGLLSTSRTSTARPSDDFSFVFTVFTAVIVGGTSISGGDGAIWRTVSAVFFLAFVSNSFNLLQIDPIWQRVIEGSIIIAAVGVDSWTRHRD